MGFGFSFIGGSGHGEHRGHSMIEDGGDDQIDYAVEDQTVDVKGIGTEAGYHGADGKTGIATDRKAAQSLSFERAGDAVDHAGCFGMEQAAAEAAHHGTEQDDPVIGRKGQCRQGQAAEDRSERDQPGLGNPVRIVSDERLCYRRQENVGKNNAGSLLVIELAGRDEIGKQGRDAALGPVYREMPHSKQIDMGIELFHENPFFMIIFIYMSITIIVPYRAHNG